MNEAVKAGHNGADRRSSYDRPVAFVLQGGGALESDQAGVYEGIAEAGYVPAWVAGVSVGAINDSSRTRMGTTSFCAEHDIRHNLQGLLAKLPDSLKDEPEVRFLRGLSCPAAIDIVQLIYRPDRPQGPWKDIEFRRATVEERWDQGLFGRAAHRRGGPAARASTAGTGCPDVRRVEGSRGPLDPRAQTELL